eukprot:TRINITY_DN4668_c0_g1_i3.p1 TRINITY_DN4668_c0_g1~~TRINITY_DN4668_c0_g1_i3.p1  ORF type:complete len:213 (+),score=74.37 TRINITY_DN4668_c0_g1_i3:45-683(+)
MRVAEHVVLFKIKDCVSEDGVRDMMQCLEKMRNLDNILLFNLGHAVNVFGQRRWTMALHGRYSSRDALENYYVSAEPVEMLEKHVQTKVEDCIVFDWEADVSPWDSEADVVCILLVKVKEGIAWGRVEKVLHELKKETERSRLPSVEQFSGGESFGSEDAMGFDVGLLWLERRGGEAAGGGESHQHSAKLQQLIDSMISPIAAEITGADFLP